MAHILRNLAIVSTSVLSMGLATVSAQAQYPAPYPSTQDQARMNAERALQGSVYNAAQRYRAGQISQLAFQLAVQDAVIFAISNGLNPSYTNAVVSATTVQFGTNISSVANFAAARAISTMPGMNNNRQGRSQGQRSQRRAPQKNKNDDSSILQTNINVSPPPPPTPTSQNDNQ